MMPFSPKMSSDKTAALVYDIAVNMFRYYNICGAISKVFFGG